MSKNRKGIKPKFSEKGLKNRLENAIQNGHEAYKNKTGIHAFSPQQLQQVSLKGKTDFMKKMEVPEYRELHKNKVKLGKIISRFNKIKKPTPEDFGFFSRN